MKSLLTTTALFEGLTGLALAIVPSFFANQLLGTSLIDTSAILIARLAGAALMVVSIACWLLRSDAQSSVMVKMMLVYNAFAASLLVYAALFEKLSGLGLWPAVFLHSGLLVWCLTSLRKRVA